MVLESAKKPNRVGQTATICQALLCTLAITAIFYAPREGQPALLLPLNAQAAGAIPALLSHPEVLILARGQVSGSYVITGNRSGFAEGLFAQGVLILNAASPGCGADNAEQLL